MIDRTKKTQKNIAIPNDIVEKIEDERSKKRPIPSFSEFGAELIELGLKAYKEKQTKPKNS